MGIWKVHLKITNQTISRHEILHRSDGSVVFFFFKYHGDCDRTRGIMRNIAVFRTRSFTLFN